MAVTLEQSRPGHFLVLDKQSGDRIGFVSRVGGQWSATDTYMSRSMTFATRREAVAWLEAIRAQGEGR